MKMTRKVLVALLLGAWAASLAQADARPRGKPTNAGRHVGVTVPAAGVVKGRGLPMRRDIPALTKKNAIGATIPPAGVAPTKAPVPTVPGPNAAGVTKTNPIGARTGTVAMPPAPAGAAKIGAGASPPTGVRPTAPTLAAHGGGINGTGINRPGTTPGVVGGPAKIVGGISGTGMKPKK
jgi:hypothetical protein